jgi:hypothetical protein
MRRNLDLLAFVELGHFCRTLAMIIASAPCGASRGIQ